MNLVVTISGVVGAWLVFWGSIYQAALELRDEDNARFARDKFRSQDKVAPISPWWWLLPPVKVVLERRRRDERQRQMLDVLSKGEVEALVSFTNKATGWQYVAIGGLCLAIEETFELTEFLHWALWLYLLVIVVLVVGGIGNVVIQLKRADRIIAAKKD